MAPRHGDILRIPQWSRASSLTNQIRDLQVLAVKVLKIRFFGVLRHVDRQSVKATLRRSIVPFQDQAAQDEPPPGVPELKRR